ncbi:hypothetical protein OFC46_27550, partial [Escherichia coli]|nr:hypothetical protein [Escherichia coli]
QMVLEPRERAIKLVYHGQRDASQQLLAVGDRSGPPLGEEVAGLGQLGGAHNNWPLTRASADKQNPAAAVSTLLANAGGAAQVC